VVDSQFTFSPDIQKISDPVWVQNKVKNDRYFAKSPHDQPRKDEFALETFLKHTNSRNISPTNIRSSAKQEALELEKLAQQSKVLFDKGLSKANKHINKAAPRLESYRAQNDKSINTEFEDIELILPKLNIEPPLSDRKYKLQPNALAPSVPISKYADIYKYRNKHPLTNRVSTSDSS
jgi:hypothetical protein